MKYDLVIRNGHVVDPRSTVNRVADVGIADGVVAEIADELSIFDADDMIDAQGLLVTPGVIDPHVHTVRPGSAGSAYKMLLRCGVTSTMDMRGPVNVLLEELRTAGAGINAGCLQALLADKDLPRETAGAPRIRDLVSARMEQGAFGAKIMGGHYPFSPEVTGRIVEECSTLGAYIAFHCGTTATGSNIKGLLEAVDLAAGRPLHIAHVNSYCRGMVDDVLDETLRGLNALRANPKIVSESYLSVMNGTYCSLDENGNIESGVTRNCLRMKNYPETVLGLEQAIHDGYCVIYSLAGGEMRLLPPREGHAYWKRFPGAQCTFAVNNPVSIVSCATARRTDGSFVVDALCSDGGANPRNVIIKNGMALVRAKYMTLDDLIHKACLAPARLFGLLNKGHLTPGADADLAVFDPLTGEARFTIVGGKIRMAHGVCYDSPGTVITSPQGVAAVKKAGLAYVVPNLAQSTFMQGHPAPEPQQNRCP